MQVLKSDLLIDHWQLRNEYISTKIDKLSPRLDNKNPQRLLVNPDGPEPSVLNNLSFKNGKHRRDLGQKYFPIHVQNIFDPKGTNLRKITANAATQPGVEYVSTIISSFHTFSRMFAVLRSVFCVTLFFVLCCFVHYYCLFCLIIHCLRVIQTVGCLPPE